MRMRYDSGDHHYFDEHRSLDGHRAFGDHRLHFLDDHRLLDDYPFDDRYFLCYRRSRFRVSTNFTA